MMKRRLARAWSSSASSPAWGAGALRKRRKKGSGGKKKKGRRRRVRMPPPLSNAVTRARKMPQGGEKKEKKKAWKSGEETQMLPDRHVHCSSLAIKEKQLGERESQRALDHALNSHTFPSPSDGKEKRIGKRGREKGICLSSSSRKRLSFPLYHRAPGMRRSSKKNGKGPW